MTYSFEKFNKERDARFLGVSISKYNLYISTLIAKKLLNFKALIVKIDKKNKALLLQSGEQGYNLLRNTGKKTFVINTHLYKVMPIGRYFLEDETIDGLIFKLK